MPDLIFTIDLITVINSDPTNSFISYQAPIVDSNNDGWQDTVLKMTLDPNDVNDYTSAYFKVEYSAAPTGVTVNIGDSVTNDSWGGDRGTQSRDAEIQVGGQNATSITSLLIYGNDYTPNNEVIEENMPRLLKREDCFTSYSSKNVLHFTVRNELIAYGNNHGVAGYLQTPSLYSLNGQVDQEGFVNYDIYAAFNRVIDNSDRSGTGVSKVTVILGTDDILYGTIGNDTLDAGAGNDYIYADLGNDIIIGNHGFDTINGSDGTDTVDYNSLNQTIILSSVNGVFQVHKAEGTEDTLTNIETVIGSNSLSDSIDFSSLTSGFTANLSRGITDLNINVLNFKNITGGSGNDNLTGNPYDNKLNGGNGNDTIIADLGNDTIYGSNGSDYINGCNGMDAVDYGSFCQAINLKPEPETGKLKVDKAEGTKDTLASIEKVAATNFNDSLIGDSKDNQFNGRTGDDTLSGGFGNDRLTGGSGADQFMFNNPDEGLDTICDFSSIEGDKIAISKTGFELPANTTTLEVYDSATGINPQWIFDQTNQILFFDSDGNGFNYPNAIAMILNGTDLSPSNFVYI